MSSNWSRERVRRYLRGSWLLLLIAIAAPVFSALGWLWKPDGIPVAAWLQRSAAVTVSLALLAQVLANKAADHLLPSGGVFGNQERVAIYHAFAGDFRWLNRLSVLLTVVGSVLWGYGDLLPIN